MMYLVSWYSLNTLKRSSQKEVIIIAKMYFKYGTVNSGKSLELLKVAHNYEEQGKNVLLLTSSLDNRYGLGKITSRVGLERDAEIIKRDSDILGIYMEKLRDISETKPEANPSISCVLVDESQFLSKENIRQLSLIVDVYDTPVIAYGLKVDFSNYLFEGSRELLIKADKMEEIKTICNKRNCESKAIMNIRIDDEGKALYEGEQIEIGGNERYVPVCRYHYYRYNNKENVNG